MKAARRKIVIDPLRRFPEAMAQKIPALADVRYSSSRPVRGSVAD